MLLETGRACLPSDFVSRPAEIANDELVLWESRVQSGFDMPERRESLGQRPPHNSDAIPRLEGRAGSA